MIIKKAVSELDRQHAFDVRLTVFVTEQHVPLSIELDAYDDEAIHFVGYDQKKPIAASRLRLIDQHGKLERICVLKGYRNQSYGKQLIKHMEIEIINKGYRKAILNAQTHAIPFYERLGYIVCSDEFIDANIPHVTMNKDL